MMEARVAQFPSITSAEVAENAPAIALLPVGSFEQHDSHLPLATDAIIAATIANRLASTYRLLELSTIPFSASHEHEGLPGRPGTVSITATTLTAIISDVRASVRRGGIERLILVNAHGGNYVLGNIVQTANAGLDEPALGLYPSKAERVAARTAAGMETGETADMHAGEFETSILLHEHPELVRPTFRDNDFHQPDRPHLLERGMAAYAKGGTIGKPSAATPAKGRLALESLTDSFARYLQLFTTDR
jgi:creatinine amidohydrolase